MKRLSLFLLLEVLACDSRQRVDQVPVPQSVHAQPAATAQGPGPAAAEAIKPPPVLGDPYGLLSKPINTAAKPTAKAATEPRVKPKETIDPGALIGDAPVEGLALPSRPNRRKADHHRKKARRSH